MAAVVGVILEVALGLKWTIEANLLRLNYHIISCYFCFKGPCKVAVHN